ncbi:hypothetical protein D3C80_1903310 [compost metagenome]
MTGSFQTEARFRLSWKAPILDAASPKLATATRPSPASCAPQARPLAIGIELPTTPVVTMIPFEG